MITKNLDIVKSKMPWLSLRGRLVSDRKSDSQEEVGCHGTHGHQNCCHGLNHVGNGGVDRERGQECF